MEVDAHEDWDDLLLQSEDLVGQDDPGVPLVSRDLRALEAFSSRLRAGGAAPGAVSGALAALRREGGGARLLAREGVDPRGLARALAGAVEAADDEASGVGALEAYDPTTGDPASAWRGPEDDPYTLRLLPARRTLHEPLSSAASAGSLEAALEAAAQRAAARATARALQSSAEALDAALEDALAARWATGGGREGAAAALGGGVGFGPPGGVLTAPDVAALAAASSAAGPEDPLSPYAFPPAARGPRDRSAHAPPPAARLRGRAEGYGRAVAESVDAAAGDGGAGVAAPPSAATRLADVALADPDAPPSLKRLWQAATSALSGPDATAGALRWLEAGHEAHVAGAVRGHMGLAARGGAPGPAAQVEAYVRVRSKDAGGAGGAVVGGAFAPQDLPYLTAFLLVRSGYATEAASGLLSLDDSALEALDGGGEVAGDDPDGAPQAATTGPREVGRLLQKWAATAARRGRGGPLPRADTVGARADLDGALSAPEPAAASPPRPLILGGAGAGARAVTPSPSAALRRTPHKLLLLALVTGSARAADALSSARSSLTGQPVLPTLDDWLWFRLASLERDEGDVAGPAAAGGAVGPATPADTSTLPSLQAHLASFPPSHYTRGGRDPSLYMLVLALTSQWARLAEYALVDPSADKVRLDGMHLAVAAMLAGRVEATLPDPLGDPAGASAGGDLPVGEGAAPDARPRGPLAAALARYARSLARARPELAASYAYLSARAGGDSDGLRAGLLRALLAEGGASLVDELAAGAADVGRPSALARLAARLVPDAGSRARVLAAAARAALAEARPDEAAALLLAAGLPAAALEVLARRLSGLAAEAAAGPSAAVADVIARGDRAAGELRRGADGGFLEAGGAAAALGGYVPPPGARGSAAASEAAAAVLDEWAQVKTATELLLAASRGDASGVLALAPRLAFVPASRRQAQAAAALAQQLPASVADRVPDVVLAVASAAAAANAPSTLEALLALAAALPAWFSAAEFRKLSELDGGARWA